MPMTLDESSCVADACTPATPRRRFVSHLRAAEPGHRVQWLLIELGILTVMSMAGFLVMGYHPGAEDDGVYLTAIKADLNPSLFPHDSDFFKLEMKATVFDTWMAAFVRRTRIPLAWSELLWQLISIYCVVLASWTIVIQLFQESAARWAAISMLVSMFTLPVAGTGLYIVDQYLHPRTLATGLILFGISRIMAGRSWQSVPLLLLACLLHPIMGAFGISFCCVLVLTLFQPLHARVHEMRTRTLTGVATPVIALIPFAWLFSPPSRCWLEATQSRHWFRLDRWTWYEWLGVVGPIVLFWLIAYLAGKRSETKLRQLATAIYLFSTIQLALAGLVVSNSSLIGFRALEPMRYLHLVYVFLALIGGACLGRYLLKGHVWRWAVFLLMANGSMFFAQRRLFAETEHLELPGRMSKNPWIQAFDWIRQNTSQDAYFALDPKYMAAPGEDYHSFRALAERSVLADDIKDTSVITKVPGLGPDWERQVRAQEGWATFRLADFERLKSEFGVNWVMTAYPQPEGLLCSWHNDSFSVCRIP